MIKSPPNPCPNLREGLALGAKEHQGFVAAWNWLIDIFRAVDKNLTTSINNRTGDIAIVAGEGIDVTTSNNTITISIGEGKNEDEGDDHNGGGAGEEDIGNTGGGEGEGDVPPWPPEDEEAQPVELGGDSGMFKWDASTTTMGVGGVMVGRQWVTASGTGQKSDGLYQVKVTINDSGTYGATVVSDASLGQAPTTTQCWIPIYQITDGKIATDYRGAFVVPAFD